MKKLIETDYNPPSVMHGYRDVRFVENVSRSLRFAGYADQLVRINHRGWFSDDDGLNGEVYRGVVFRLPGRKHSSRFVYGYEDPNNDDCALICFGDVVDSEEQAARAADRFAEIFAEAARDYDRAWQAGRRCEELDEQVKEARREALEIGQELRLAGKCGVAAPTLCKVLRARVFELRRQMLRDRRERDGLVENFGTQDGFKE